MDNHENFQQQNTLYIKFQQELNTFWLSNYLKHKEIEVIDIKHDEKTVGILVVEQGDFINCIYVEPDYRRMGLAKTAVKDYFKGKNSLPSLIIIDNNTKAKKFWHSIFELMIVDKDVLELETKYRAIGWK